MFTVKYNVLSYTHTYTHTHTHTHIYIYISYISYVLNIKSENIPAKVSNVVMQLNARAGVNFKYIQFAHNICTVYSSTPYRVSYLKCAQIIFISC